ncbi:MAG: bifunctional riboflavin kinase/FAD synthetase [Betaproteobacteria bacterium]|nr:MAG: bifunctional riboflavin kinase/FAD synthetase [Betaproteobacteria bacterium]
MKSPIPGAPSLARDLHPHVFSAVPTAVSLGNFDGVHRGHQAMLEVVCQAARQRKLKPTALTFAPAPGQFFARRAEKTPPARLQRLRDKLACIWAVGIEHVQLLRFNEALASMSPDAFCEQFLRHGLNAKWLIVGDDFRYGKDRSGDVKTLHAWCAANGVECYVMPAVKAMDVRFSSSLVRTALRDGDCVTAAAILGRPYRISGRIAHGDKLGRTLGFPTINIPLWTPLPVQGIFAVRVYGVDVAGASAVLGAASVGVRPTVKENGKPLLEVFLLDFKGDLYGRRVVVEFVKRIRAEEKFDSIEVMTAQMHRDIAAVRDVFA